MTFPPIVTSHIWTQLKTLLAGDAVMEDLLYGPGHIYTETEDYAEPEGEEGVPWIRVVIAPAGSLWPMLDAPGMFVPRSFIVKTECNKFDGPGFDHQLALEAVQARIHTLLSGYVPPTLPGIATRVAFPIFHHRVIEPRILWDEIRRVYFLTSEYRTELTAT